MEKQTKKTKHNSSLPSSQTEKDETGQPQVGAHGQDKPLKEDVAHHTRVNKTVALLTVHACDNCGEDLTHTPCSTYERRTKIDIVFEKTMEHRDVEIKQCPICDATLRSHDIKICMALV